MKMREYYNENGELRIRTPVGNAVDGELQRQWNYLRSKGLSPIEQIVDCEPEHAFPGSIKNSLLFPAFRRYYCRPPLPTAGARHNE
jgi:hypothetical protein